MIQLKSALQKPNHARTGQSLCQLILVGVLLLVGCNDSATNKPANSEGETSANIPRLHKPKEFSVAVERLDELLGAITSEDPLPDDVTYEVTEVIHGEGPGAHSHYYLAYEEADQPKDDHGGKSSTKRHKVSVDVFSEFSDIVEWLPSIAADGDMAKDEWQQVSNTSKELQTLVDKSLNASTEQEQRQEFVAHQAEIETKLKSLKKLADATDSPDTSN
ncbi:MAG: hypothetical protein AAFN77_06875 [Planctomycetota bacterium]